MLVAFAIVACVLGVLTLALTLYGVLGVFGGVLGLALGVGLLVVAPLLATKRVERWLERDAPLPWQARAKVLGVVGALAFASLVGGSWDELRKGLARFFADVKSAPTPLADAGADGGVGAGGDAATDAPADAETDGAADAAVDAPPAPPEDRAVRWSAPTPLAWALGDDGSAAILVARDDLQIRAADGAMAFDRKLDLELDPKIAYQEGRGVLAVAYAGKPAEVSVVFFAAKGGDTRWSHKPARKRATRAFFGGPGVVFFVDDAMLTALDEAKGAVLWTASLDAPHAPGASVVATADVLGDRTLVTLVSSSPRESSLRVLEADGGVAWKLTQPGVLSTQAVAGGPFLLSSLPSGAITRLEARDPASGEIRFEQRVGDGGALAALGEIGAGGLSFSREGEVLVARDVQTGAARFELPLPAGTAFVLGPARRGVVLVTSSAADTTLARYDEAGARKAYVRAPFVGAPLAACEAGVLLSSLRDGEIRFVPW